MLIIDPEKCVGCRACEKGCPFDGLVMTDNLPQVLENCTLCGICVNLCEYHAISIDRHGGQVVSLEDWKAIMVWVEWEDRGNGPRIKDVTLELLGKARGMVTTTKESVIAALAGPPGLEGLGEELFRYGADRVVYLENELLKRYTTDGYANALSYLISSDKPSVVLFGATVNGRDLAPRIAARLGVGITADCTELSIDDGGQLVQTRPAFGGNVMASILSPDTRPQMATVRPRVFKIPPPDDNRKGVIEIPEMKISRRSIRTEIVEEVREEKEDIRIEESKVLVSIGRGITNRENLEMVRELACELGATMSSSRSLVELGWMPPSSQVGQSGKTVMPKLYLALGISGAIQHLVGMSSSDVVVAVNKDPDAPIFKVADFGIVGDVFEVVPAILMKLKERKAMGEGPGSRA
ncbi:MAG: electron transfer flavoprotein subunit alpha [Methanomassiliicoccales archaeon]|nr:electron transfer flavoprotein subunit alpha [Methanomassiliicoccales archaeon]NYT15627.1 electron transfer flavoprotein subunit alpha [Methanomassiliicoccales archaeon]